MPNTDPAAVIGLPNSSLFEFQIPKDDSECPSICAGGVVRVDASDRELTYQGGAFAIEEAGQAVVRKLQLLPSGRVLIVLDTGPSQERPADEVKVLGRVLGVFFDLYETEGHDNG